MVLKIVPDTWLALDTWLLDDLRTFDNHKDESDN